MFSPDVFQSNKPVNIFFEPKKMDSSVSYSNYIMNSSSAMLTPTSPQTFCFPTKSFDSVDYMSTDSFNVSTQSANYNNDCFNWFDMSSAAETPNSAQSAIPTTTKAIKEEIFNFEPEYIELFQRNCDNPTSNVNDFEQTDNDYMNFNESNCQSKSICNSPNIESLLNSGDSIPSTAVNGLPPISTFSEQFQNNYLDRDDFDLIEHDSAMIQNDINFQTMNNFNFNQTAEDKCDRDEKNIWEMLNIDTSQPESPTDNIFIDEIPDCKNDTSIEAEKISNIVDDDIDVKSNEKDWICQWENCFEIYRSQAELVKHIEKTHIEVKKGDAFSCFWLDCARQHKPFNARYKLLIHMRVHSGEKPNKCQVSSIDCFLKILFCIGHV